MRLNELAPGGVGRVAGLDTEGTMRRRLLELGLVPGTGVKCLGGSPMGGPAAFEVWGGVVGPRSRDSAGVLLEDGPWA